MDGVKYVQLEPNDARLGIDHVIVTTRTVSIVKLRNYVFLLLFVSLAYVQ